MDNLNPPPWTRHDVPANPIGLGGMDHVALSAHDPIRAARFYVEVLGGTLYDATGFSDEERGRGRIPHSFVSSGHRGYLEDRRPNSMADPYRITGRIIQTIESVTAQVLIEDAFAA